MNEAAADCFGNNSCFAHEAGRGWVRIVRLACDTPELRAVLADPDAALAHAELRKDSRSTRAGVLTLADGGAMFIKRYNNRGLRHALRYLFRRAKPFRAWAAAWVCEQHGVPTPRPCAVVAERRAGLLHRAWLVTEAVTEAVPTLRYAEQLLHQPRLREDFVNQSCRLLAAMHAAGVRHGDPKLSNIYACRTTAGFRYGVWDLDGAVLEQAPLPDSARLADLARTAASLVDIAARLGRALRPETQADAFCAAYAAAAGQAPDRTALLPAMWRHLRR